MRWLVTLALASCAQHLSTHSQTVAGRVVLTGAADFSGALVSIDDGAAQRTAGFGDFAFSASPGTHIITARCECDTLEQRVATAVVVGAAPLSGVALVLTPVGRVQGSITNSAHEPVLGVRVFAAGTAAVAYSQADGSYVLPHVPLGTRTLVASEEGYLTQTQAGVAIGSADVVANFVMPIDDTPDPNAPNQAPVISAFTFAPAPAGGRNPQPIPVASPDTPNVVHASAPLALTVTATDPEGGVLTYLWSADKGQISGSTADATVQWVPSDEGGEVVVVVVDAQGAAATARHAFTAPPKSIRGATLYHDEVIYSEGRTDTRDVVGFDLGTRTERTIAGGSGEQNSPRVVGDTLAFGDQVFTLVNPTIFHMHLLGLGATKLDTTFGRDLQPDESISVNFRLDTALTAGAVTYVSFDDSLAPFGIGTFDVASQTFTVLPEGGVQTPDYPCYVSLGTTALGVIGDALHAFAQSDTVVATLPADDCVEMQADGAWVAIRQSSPGGALTLANWQSGEVRALGTHVNSFALHGTQLAYSDTRSGFSGVYLYDVSADTNASVPTFGPSQRRVLELSDKWLVYGELSELADPASYSATSLWAYQLP